MMLRTIGSRFNQVGGLGRGYLARHRGGGGAPVTPKARYWRLRITAVNGGDGYTEIHGIEFFSALYGPNVANGGTAFAGSNFGSSVPSRVFDSDYSTEWIGSTASLPQTIGYDFGAGNEQAICAVGVLGPGVGYTGRAPTAFDVQYSSDNTNWTTAWSVSGSTGWGTLEYRRFKHPDATAKFYRGSPWGAHTYWRCHAMLAEAGLPSVAEIAYRATIGGANQSIGATAYASTEFDAGYVAANAIDGNPATAWSAENSDGNRWHMCGFAAPVKVGELAITARADSGSTAFGTFSIQFADSIGGPWTTAWQEKGITGWTAGLTRTFTDPAYL